MEAQDISEKIKELEKETQNTAIYLVGNSSKISRQESKGKLHCINEFDYNSITHYLKNPSNLPNFKNSCDLFLSSAGGSIVASSEIMNELHRAFDGRVRVHVRHFALSSATFMALSGKSLFIDDTAIVSDFLDTRNNIQNQMEPEIVDKFLQFITEGLERGEIVNNGDIIKILAVNGVASAMYGHEEQYDFASYKKLLTKTRVEIQSSLSEQMNEEPESGYSSSHAYDLSKEIGQGIQELINNKKYAKAIFISHNAHLMYS